MSRIRRRINLGLLLSAAALLGGVQLATPAAEAATTPAVEAAAPTQTIFGPCTPFQDGQIKVIGQFLYECVFVKGLGYYWVRYSNSCSGAATRNMAARRC